eukprot:COSAG03_NODE_32_length_18233_cov_11.266847_4_plen_81_part_00
MSTHNYIMNNGCRLTNGELSTFSSLDNLRPRLETAVMALATNGKCQDFVLEPGEVLFYPTQFWQCVHLNDNISWTRKALL